MRSLAKVGIIVLHYNGLEDTVECVKSLLQNLEGEYRIFVVDNCSTDNSYQSLQSESVVQNKKVELLQTDQNRGFSAGNNHGAKYAMMHYKPDYFWFLNNDTSVRDKILPDLIQFYRQQAKMGILGVKLKLYHQQNLIQAIGGEFLKHKARLKQIGFMQKDNHQFDYFTEPVDFVIGASMFVSKEFIEEVGLLSEDYFLFYEELDWAIRAKRKGYLCYTNTKVEVLHKQGKATGNRGDKKKSKRAMFYQFRNLILIYKKYFPALVFLPIIVVSLRSLKFAVLRDPNYLQLWFKVLFNLKNNYD